MNRLSTSALHALSSSHQLSTLCKQYSSENKNAKPYDDISVPKLIPLSDNEDLDLSGSSSPLLEGEDEVQIALDLSNHIRLQSQENSYLNQAFKAFYAKEYLCFCLESLESFESPSNLPQISIKSPSNL